MYVIHAIGFINLKVVFFGFVAQFKTFFNIFNANSSSFVKVVF